MKSAPPVGRPVTLRESRVRLALLTGMLATVAIAGVVVVAGGDRSAAAWAGALVSGAATLILGWGFVRGRMLTLDAEGFEATIGVPGRRPIRVRWRDVTRFSQVHIPGQTIVGFHLRPGAAVTSRLRRLVEDAMIPDAPRRDAADALRRHERHRSDRLPGALAGIRVVGRPTLNGERRAHLDTPSGDPPN